MDAPPYSRIVIALADLNGLMVQVKGDPVKQTLQLEISSGVQQALQVVLSDVSGKVLHKQAVTVPAGTRLVHTDVSAYPNGTYFIRVITANGVVITEKLLYRRVYKKIKDFRRRIQQDRSGLKYRGGLFFV